MTQERLALVLVYARGMSGDIPWPWTANYWLQQRLAVRGVTWGTSRREGSA